LTFFSIGDLFLSPQGVVAIINSKAITSRKKTTSNNQHIYEHILLYFHFSNKIYHGINQRFNAPASTKGKDAQAPTKCFMACSWLYKKHISTQPTKE
jgi:hypothetical protein